MNERTRKPQAFTWADADAPAHNRKKQAREPKTIPLSRVDFEEEPPSTDAISVHGQPMLLHRGVGWASLFIACLGLLLSLWAGLGVARLTDELFSISPGLGWLGLGLLALAGLAALAVVLREMIGLVRLKRLVRVHEDAERALNVRDNEAAERVLRELRRIYGGRGDLRWGLEQLAGHCRDVISADDRIKLAERDLMELLDENALALIARASRRVTVLTAVTPAAALDILFVAALNLRMLREIATLYGGRPGTLGTFRLARMVIAHLAVTGGLALSDNLLQHLIGRGLVGRLSARFGEGAVNGILTARIGLAAMDLCRPLPFTVRARPSLAAFIRQLLFPEAAAKPPEAV